MLALGVDVGTGKVAVSLVAQGGAQVHSAAAPHGAVTAAPAGHYEQDPVRIRACAEQLIAGLPADLRAQIGAIGFTGQMHGVVLHDIAARPLSPLITWQDRRTLEDPAFLPSLGRQLHAGYGMATLAWLARHGALPAGARAATIHGFLAAAWGGLERAPLDPTDAHAWGGLAPLPGLAAEVLPTAVDHGQRCGSLTAAAAATLGLRAGIPFAAPLGDNQASMRATLADPAHQLAFTLGTGCQLAAIVPQGTAADVPGCEIRPFSDSHVALVAAPLAGGAAWLWLADTAAGWVRDLGLEPPPRDVLFARLDELGRVAADNLTIRSHLAGERFAPGLTGSIAGLTLERGRLGEVARALARGIAVTARDMLPRAAFAGRTQVVASGNALRRSRLLRAMAEAEFGLPLVLVTCSEEAATGAALVALPLMK